MAQATAVGAAAGAVGAGIVLSSRAQSVLAALVPVLAALVSVWAALVSWAATRPLMKPAGTHFARMLAWLLGPAKSTSDLALLNDQKLRAFHKEISPHINQETARRVLDADWLQALESKPAPQK